MRIFNVLNNTQGFAKAAQNHIQWRDMRNKEEAERRAKILTFWKEYGLDATRAAFAVSRSTLYLWQQNLNKAQGKLTALDPKSTAPKKRRSRDIPHELIAAIKAYRIKRPRIGQKKLTPLLKKQGFDVRQAYIGRCIADLKKRGLLEDPVPLSFYARSGKHHIRKKTKAKKKRRKQKRGFEIDTVVRHVDGKKRYIITAIDTQRKIAYAYTYATHSSASARDFLKRLLRNIPFEITEIQTDNGSEFAGYFQEACKTLGITHYHTYPRSPKMNAFIERFNRTLSEEYVIYHRALMRDDVEGFNEELSQWLRWYNHERPHESLGLLSPYEYYEVNYRVES